MSYNAYQMVRKLIQDSVVEKVRPSESFGDVTTLVAARVPEIVALAQLVVELNERVEKLEKESRLRQGEF